MNPKPLLCSLTLGLAMLGSAAIIAAGPLNPPPGAITSNYKTLTEVEPRIAISAANTPGDANSVFKITQPGSYYLTANIIGVSAKHGIEIATSGVTIDLSGFDLIGVTGSLSGIASTVSNLTNLAVLNGSIRFWGASGIDFGGITFDGRIVGVQSSDNGVDGIIAGNAYTITNCSAYSNNGAGLRAASSTTFNSCASLQNGGGGIVANINALITACIANQNSGNGIATLGSSTITSCVANSNTLSGISVASASTVVGCTSNSNTLDGILCSSQCHIRENSCANNGNGAGDGAGVHATSSQNHIECNNCANADRGIDVDAIGNFIVKNTCSANTTNWSIVANNYYGPIVDRAGVATAGVNGSVAASTLASTDANANFSY